MKKKSEWDRLSLARSRAQRKSRLEFAQLVAAGGMIAGMASLFSGSLYVVPPNGPYLTIAGQCLTGLALALLVAKAPVEIPVRLTGLAFCIIIADLAMLFMIADTSGRIGFENSVAVFSLAAGPAAALPAFALFASVRKATTSSAHTDPVAERKAAVRTAAKTLSFSDSDHTCPTCGRNETNTPGIKFIACPNPDCDAAFCFSCWEEYNWRCAVPECRAHLRTAANTRPVNMK